MTIAPPSEQTSATVLPEAKEAATLPVQVTASPNFSLLLAEHRLSLLVSTYEAGKLIILRTSGQGLNVHFIGFTRAMGIAANVSRLAIGMARRIQEHYNMPALCAKLPSGASPQPPRDACYIPRNSHVTGDVDVHEMAYAGDELWFVNTRFSCLCTLDPAYSFAPRWRPPFVKGLSGDDRCHLNGLALVDDRPAYVSAFGVSDEPEGWRPQRTTGGLVMEDPSGEIVARGLSMPHSPRVYGGRLWVLDSGRGTLAGIDRQNGSVETVAEFSGFTRGLDFSRNLAFVGLSQMRKKNLSYPQNFGGVPLTERLPEEERYCGIQVLNLATGRIEAFLKFDSGVQEIFAVQALRGVRYPEILEETDPLVGSSFSLSPEALAQVSS